MQNLAEIVAYEAVTSKYSTPVQAAGLPMTTLNPSWYATPAEYEHAMVRRLQTTLPRSEPWSVRASASPQMPASEFAVHAEKVKAAALAAAHQAPELRAVVMRDRTGREVTEFFGKKSSWMRQYAKPAQLMESFNGQPVRLPTIL